MKLAKIQLHEIGHSGGLLGRLLGPLLKTGLSLMKNVIKALAKSSLIPLGLTAALSARDVWIWYLSFRLSKGNDINNF